MVNVFPSCILPNNIRGLTLHYVLREVYLNHMSSTSQFVPLKMRSSQRIFKSKFCKYPLNSTWTFSCQYWNRKKLQLCWKKWSLEFLQVNTVMSVYFQTKGSCLEIIDWTIDQNSALHTVCLMIIFLLHNKQELENFSTT